MIWISEAVQGIIAYASRCIPNPNPQWIIVPQAQNADEIDEPFDVQMKVVSWDATEVLFPCSQELACRQGLTLEVEPSMQWEDWSWIYQPISNIQKITVGYSWILVFLGEIVAKFVGVALMLHRCCFWSLLVVCATMDLLYSGVGTFARHSVLCWWWCILRRRRIRIWSCASGKNRGVNELCTAINLTGLASHHLSTIDMAVFDKMNTIHCLPVGDASHGINCLFNQGFNQSYAWQGLLQSKGNSNIAIKSLLYDVICR